MRRLPAPEESWAAACRICCGPTSRPFAICFACRTVSRALNLPLHPVLPAQVCPVPGPLYRMLMGYKESPVDEVRRRYSRSVGDSFATFFAAHIVCVLTALGGAGGPRRAGSVDFSPRTGLSRTCRWAGGRRGQGDRARGTMGAVDIAAGQRRDRAHASEPTAFVVPGPCRAALHGSRVILLDDVYVSGSRTQSAAAALRLSGARSVLIVPLGRVVRPDSSATHAAFFRPFREPATATRAGVCWIRPARPGRSSARPSALRRSPTDGWRQPRSVPVSQGGPPSAVRRAGNAWLGPMHWPDSTSGAVAA